MKISQESLSGLTDDTLLSRVYTLVASERKTTAQLIACLAEVEARGLHLSLGFSSLYAYCTEHLHLTEHAAYARIEAARVSRRYPVVLEMLESGDLSLTSLTLLGRHLTNSNYRGLLADAKHARKSDVERLVARLAPWSAAPAMVRRLPQPTPVVVARVEERSLLSLSSGVSTSLSLPGGNEKAGSSIPPPASSPLGRASTPPLEERYRVHVTISKQAHAELMRARDLLRHAVPSGDIGLVVERAISALLNDLESRKLARVARPREGGRSARTDTRNIPAAVRREVWRRDRARCAFVGPAGRCRERGFLELHHVVPFAAGGLATAANIELRCRAHNAHESQVYFGGVRAP